MAPHSASDQERRKERFIEASPGNDGCPSAHIPPTRTQTAMRTTAQEAGKCSAAMGPGGNENVLRTQPESLPTAFESSRILAFSNFLGTT